MTAPLPPHPSVPSAGFDRLLLLLVRARLRLLAPRDDRGDVPGWVLVTVMTVGLVGAISGIAKDQLSGMLSDALDSVK